MNLWSDRQTQTHTQFNKHLYWHTIFICQCFQTQLEGKYCANEMFSWKKFKSSFIYIWLNEEHADGAAVLFVWTINRHDTRWRNCPRNKDQWKQRCTRWRNCHRWQKVTSTNMSLTVSGACAAEIIHLIQDPHFKVFFVTFSISLHNTIPVFPSD